MTKRDRKRVQIIAFRLSAEHACPLCLQGPEVPHAPACRRDAMPTANDYSAAEALVRDMLAVHHQVEAVRLDALMPGTLVVDCDGDTWAVTETGALFAPNDPERVVEWARQDLDEAEELFGPFVLAADFLDVRDRRC